MVYVRYHERVEELTPSFFVCENLSNFCSLTMKDRKCVHQPQKGLRCADLAGNREYRSMNTDKGDSRQANSSEVLFFFLTLQLKIFLKRYQLLLV